MVAPTTTAFCPRCGQPNDGGTCTNCGAPSKPADIKAPAAAPAGIPSRWVLTIVVAVLVVQTIGLAVLAVGQVQLRHDERRAQKAQRAALTAALRDVNKKLDDSKAEANGLSTRVGDLETKVADQPDPAAVADKVEVSVFTIETDEGLGSAWVISSD